MAFQKVLYGVKVVSNNEEQYNLSFVCNKKWDELEITALSKVRFCNDCQKEVFLVKTASEFLAESTLKHCVAISDRDGFINKVGIR